MNKQVRDLIEAGYVTRKQAAAILGKGDGGNIVKLCKHGGVRMIQIPFGTKTTTLFLKTDVVRLAEKTNKQSRSKQAELPAMPKPEGKFFSPPNMQRIIEDSIKIESEMMDALGRIEAMLTALLKRED